MSSSNSNRRYHIHGKNFFLTYPQCPVSKQVCLELLKPVFGIDAQFVIAQETHEDSEYHLHVFVQIPKAKDYYTPTFADLKVTLLLGPDNSEVPYRVYHGNYECVRNLKNTVDYIHKEDKEPLYFPADFRPSGKKTTKWDDFAALIDGGATLEMLRKADPGFFYNNLEKARKAITYMKSVHMQGNVIGLERFLNWSVPAEKFLGLKESTIAIWTQLRLLLGPTGSGKQHLYLWGSPGIGKSTFLTKLRQFLRIYVIPTEDFYCLYEDQKYDIAVLDEFKASKPIQWLNQFLDGSPVGMSLRVKGAQTLKTQFLPTILVSNYRVDDPDMYTNLYQSVQMEALVRRLKVVQMDQVCCQELSDLVDLAVTQITALPVMNN